MEERVMSDQKVPKTINDFISDNVQVLASLFPAAVKDGQVDFTALKEELGQFEEVDKEKYELTWAGKQEAKKKAQEDVFGRTLKYIHEDSKNPETTENLYIEGDNLEVLKLLRQNYYGSIKMIYIDPPYNTGNDFVYNDSFKMDAKESDIAEGTLDEYGEKLQKNQKSTNRFHANWLNMMYPRLKVAKDLLTDDGVVFISIDDNEELNLQKIVDEIFGESNRIGKLVWKKKYTGGKHTSTFADYHEFILVYAKNINNVENIEMDRPDDEMDKFELTDEYFKERGGYYIRPLKSNLDPRPTLVYPIDLPDGSQIETQWIVAKSTFEDMLAEGRILFKKKRNGKYQVYKKYYQNDGGGKVKIPSFLEISSNSEGKEELKSLFDISQTRDLPFSTPKPLKLLKFLIKNFSNENDIVMDFFSGSATTGHALFELNFEQNTKRKFILVQVSEILSEDSKEDKSAIEFLSNIEKAYNVSEIGKERIRRAGEKVKHKVEEYNAQLKMGEELKPVPDIGFKVFRTADTNIKWNLIESEGQMDTEAMTHTPDLADFTFGFNDIDVVYEIMLRQKDIPLSEKLEVLSDIGTRTYLYGSAYLICLETNITEELIGQLAGLNPLPIKFVFRDTAFKDDIDLKDDTFRLLKSLIDRNSGANKNTYTVEFI
jgi:adenine-specific DNA-methyltransferase